MFFYCCGGLLAYSLLYRSNAIPRLISGFGVVAVSAAMVAVVFALLGNPLSVFVSMPVALFELTIGTWLVLRGMPDRSLSQQVPRVHELFPHDAARALGRRGSEG
jgi:Domain of unknown function (DUF4386)